jgi:hypothetical protein
LFTFRHFKVNHLNEFPKLAGKYGHGGRQDIERILDVTCELVQKRISKMSVVRVSTDDSVCGSCVVCEDQIQSSICRLKVTLAGQEVVVAHRELTVAPS